jgi:hypothetical protein
MGECSGRSELVVEGAAGHLGRDDLEDPDAGPRDARSGEMHSEARHLIERHDASGANDDDAPGSPAVRGGLVDLKGALGAIEVKGGPAWTKANKDLDACDGEVHRDDVRRGNIIDSDPSYA